MTSVFAGENPSSKRFCVQLSHLYVICLGGSTVWFLHATGLVLSYARF